jgi:tetratricopeptide (TPR) repeat protein
MGTVTVAPAGKTWWAVALLVVSICAAYGNSLHGPFIFDDEPSIVENRSIRHLGSLQVLAAPPDAVTTTGRPVVNLSLAINYAIGGLAVEGYHAVNLALHILAAWVLFALVRRTLLLPTVSAQFGAAPTGFALAVSLLWAMHPLQTESVTYVVQRTEAMAGLFLLLTIYCCLRGATATRGSAWYAAAVGTCALGMASKEVMVSAPLLAILFDRTFIAGSFKESLRRRWRLWLGLTATWLLLPLLHHMSRNRGGSAGFGLGLTAWEYTRTQFGCIVHYLRLAFWPSPLVLDYGCPIARGAAEIVPQAVGVFVLVAATVAGLVWRPTWGFLGGWFFAILAPTSSIVPLATQTEAEHRMYLPLAAVVAVAVLLAYLAMGRLGVRSNRTMAALGFIAVAGLGWGTHQRNKAYQSELAIWDDTVRNCPLNDRAYLTRGSVYWTNGQRDAALRDYDQAIALNSQNAKAYLGRGNVYLDQGRYEDSLRDYDKALKVNPGLADAHNGRGQVLGYKGQVAEAIREFKRAIELYPELAQAHYNLANAFHALGAVDAAIDSYDRVIGLRPDFANAYNSRGSLFDNKGQVDAAIRDYDRAIELRPDFAEAYSNRCSAHDVKGQGDAAIRDCDRAIELRPDFAEAYTNHGNALQGKGQYQAAIKDYDKAIELKPALTVAYQNRAMALAQTRAYDRAWADVRMVQRLGGTPSPTFVEELTKNSGRSE